MKQIKHLF